MISDCKGKLYFIKLDDYENCYKIGCTQNLEQRLCTLQSRFGNISIVCVKDSNAIFQCEQKLKDKLYLLSNSKHSCDRSYNNMKMYATEYPGGVGSLEHLKVDPVDIPYVTNIFKHTQ